MEEIKKELDDVQKKKKKKKKKKRKQYCKECMNRAKKICWMMLWEEKKEQILQKIKENIYRLDDV